MNLIIKISHFNYSILSHHFKNIFDIIVFFPKITQDYNDRNVIKIYYFLHNHMKDYMNLDFKLFIQDFDLISICLIDAFINRIVKKIKQINWSRFG